MSRVILLVLVVILVEDVFLTTAVNEKIQDLYTKEFFSDNCGWISTDDKVTGGTEAGLGAYPFMTLLGYTQKGTNTKEFLCAGTLITNRFVLTASHCTLLGKYRLSFVRFGEYNLTSEIDCIIYPGSQECADPYLDVLVEKVFRHLLYDTRTIKNDIALLKTEKSVEFTDYIKPICLPFGENVEESNLEGKRFFIAGWGKTDYRKKSGSTVLQYAKVFIRNHTFCNSLAPAEVRDLSESQICANGDSLEDACKGDSGGPMFNIALKSGGSLKAYQIGLVSFSRTAHCGTTALPPVYTRVDKYLDWILETISNDNVV